MFRRSLTFVGLGLALVGGTSQAQTIRLNTGVDAGGAVLGNLALDPFWTISTDGGTTFNAAKVAAPGNPIICCGMESVGGTFAQWISDQSINGTTNGTAWGVGNTVYARRTFDLTGYDISTVSLSGFWRVADLRLGVFLNGNLLAGTDDGLSAWAVDQALSTNTGFVNGVNEIELRGESINGIWDGFYVDAQVAGRLVSTVPEPSTFALLALGVLVIGGVATRRTTSTSQAS